MEQKIQEKKDKLLRDLSLNNLDMAEKTLTEDTFNIQKKLQEVNNKVDDY